MTEREQIADGDPFLPEGWTIGPERGSIDFPEHIAPHVPLWGITVNGFRLTDGAP